MRNTLFILDSYFSGKLKILLFKQDIRYFFLFEDKFGTYSAHIYSENFCKVNIINTTFENMHSFYSSKKIAKYFFSIILLKKFQESELKKRHFISINVYFK